MLTCAAVSQGGPQHCSRGCSRPSPIIQLHSCTLLQLHCIIHLVHIIHIIHLICTLYTLCTFYILCNQPSPTILSSTRNALKCTVLHCTQCTHFKVTWILISASVSWKIVETKVAEKFSRDPRKFCCVCAIRGHCVAIM